MASSSIFKRRTSSQTPQSLSSSSSSATSPVTSPPDTSGANTPILKVSSPLNPGRGSPRAVTPIPLPPSLPVNGNVPADILPPSTSTGGVIANIRKRARSFSSQKDKPDPKLERGASTPNALAHPPTPPPIAPRMAQSHSASSTVMGHDSPPITSASFVRSHHPLKLEVMPGWARSRSSSGGGLDSVYLPRCGLRERARECDVDRD